MLPGPEVPLNPLQLPEAPPAAPLGTIDPPPTHRKKRAQRLSEKAWLPYKDRIIRLRLQDRLPLAKIKEIMEGEGFHAEYVSGVKPASRTNEPLHVLMLTATPRIRQYQYFLSRSGLDRNVKPGEMRPIVRARQRRRLIDRQKGELRFTVRGQEVNSTRIDRFMREHRISQHLLYSPSSIGRKSYPSFSSRSSC